MRAAAIASLALGAVAGPTPTFPQQWSAFIAQDMLQAQGAHYISNGDVCCTPQDNDCQVQFQSQAGMLYFDFPNNRTSNVFGAMYQPYAIVTILDGKDGNGKEYAVDQNFVCQSYCPAEGPMEPFDVEGYTDMGPTTINGVNAELWQAVDEIPYLNITMEIDNVYVDQTNINNAVPVMEIDQLTPFGEQLGTANTTYTQFTPGAPDAKWFNVTGIKDCPMDSGCDQSSVRQLHRRIAGRKAAFWRAIMRVRAEKARAVLAAAKALEERV